MRGGGRESQWRDHHLTETECCQARSFARSALFCCCCWNSVEIAEELILCLCIPRRASAPPQRRAACLPVRTAPSSRRALSPDARSRQGSVALRARSSLCTRHGPCKHTLIASAPHTLAASKRLSHLLMVLACAMLHASSVRQDLRSARNSVHTRSTSVCASRSELISCSICTRAMRESEPSVFLTLHTMSALHAPRLVPSQTATCAGG